MGLPVRNTLCIYEVSCRLKYRQIILLSESKGTSKASELGVTEGETAFACGEFNCTDADISAGTNRVLAENKERPARKPALIAVLRGCVLLEGIV